MRIGSLPGPSFAGNDFIGTFCDSLRAQGHSIVDLSIPLMVRPKSVDIVHIHWPEQIFWGRKNGAVAAGKALHTLAMLHMLKRAGVRIVWMVHNLQPHDASAFQMRLWTPFSRAVARLADGYVTLSPATLPLVAARFPFPATARSLAVRHPPYQIPADLADREAARRIVNSRAGGRHLVFVGAVRPYKGAIELARLVSELPPERVTLAIAGKCDPSLRPALEELARRHRHISFSGDRLDEGRFVAMIRSADYVALPFQNSLHSGSVIHALSLGRPVLTPRNPFAEELGELIGSEWLRVYDGRLQAKDLLDLPPPPAGEPDLAALSPEIMGRELDRFYRSLVGRSV